jgi:hypothetical protein
MIEVIANIFGVVGGFYAVYRHFEARRVVPVPVSIRCNGSTVAQFSIPKSQFSRAEVLGRIGMIAKVQRVSIAALSSMDTIAAIDAVTTGNKYDLVINVTEQEKDQF